MTYDAAEWQDVTTAAHVTDEVLAQVREIESGWYADGPIDWEDVWDRLERSTLSNGLKISLGGQNDSSAMRKIQRVIRAERRAG